MPIEYITNGVHTGTWLARRMKELYDHYLDAGWSERIDDPVVWQGVDRIPDKELWETRRHLKRKLAARMRSLSGAGMMAIASSGAPGVVRPGGMKTRFSCPIEIIGEGEQK